MHRKRIKVLYIAAFFPPAGGVGTFRARKLVKYLGVHNVDTTVVSLTDRDYSSGAWPMDLGGLGDVPESTKIIRIGARRIPAVKDIGLRWTFSLLRHLGEVVTSIKPDVMLFTGDPFFPMVLGAWFRWTSQIPFVLDFRDPWTTAVRAKGIPRPLKLRLVDNLSELSERIAVRGCSRLVVVSAGMAHDYAAKYPNLSRRISLIPNGYDPDDYDSVHVDPSTAGCLIYTGKFRTGELYRNPENVFRAMRKLRDANKPLRFIHVGVREPKVFETAAAWGVEDLVECTGFLPLRATIGLIKGAAVAVLIGGGQVTEQTTKVFDYMACKRPILALVDPGSSAADVLGGYSPCALVEGDPNKIADAICTLCESGQSYSSGRLNEFARPEIARQFANVLRIAAGAE